VKSYLKSYWNMSYVGILLCFDRFFNVSFNWCILGIVWNFLSTPNNSILSSGFALFLLHWQEHLLLWLFSMNDWTLSEIFPFPNTVTVINHYRSNGYTNVFIFYHSQYRCLKTGKYNIHVCKNSYYMLNNYAFYNFSILEHYASYVFNTVDLLS